MGGCKWCAQGQCWTHSKTASAVWNGSGGRTVIPTIFKKGGGKKGSWKGGGKGAGCKWCAQGECWTHGGSRKGGGKSFGGKSFGGGGGGQWLFVQDSSSSSSWGFGSKGKGKGKGKKDAQWNKAMDKLAEIEADRKVWVGGLNQKTTWKALEKHFEENGATKPKVTEVMRGGKGVCAFATAEEAQAAIAAMNGTELDGQSLEVDVWTEKEKTDRPKRKFGSAFVKGKQENLTLVGASKKVWVGGMSESTTASQVKKHFVDGGCAADKSKLMKKGTACVTFKKDEEATSAIAAMNATELNGKTIEVDVWTKSEKN